MVLQWTKITLAMLIVFGLVQSTAAKVENVTITPVGKNQALYRITLTNGSSTFDASFFKFEMDYAFCGALVCGDPNAVGDQFYFECLQNRYIPRVPLFNDSVHVVFPPGFEPNQIFLKSGPFPELAPKGGTGYGELTIENGEATGYFDHVLVRPPLYSKENGRVTLIFDLKNPLNTGLAKIGLKRVTTALGGLDRYCGLTEEEKNEFNRKLGGLRGEPFLNSHSNLRIGIKGEATSQPANLEDIDIFSDGKDQYNGPTFVELPRTERLPKKHTATVPNGTGNVADVTARGLAEIGVTMTDQQIQALDKLRGSQALTSWDGLANQLRAGQRVTVDHQANLSDVYRQLGVGQGTSVVLAALTDQSQAAEGAVVLTSYDPKNDRFTGLKPGGKKISLASGELLKGNPWFMVIQPPASKSQ